MENTASIAALISTLTAQEAQQSNHSRTELDSHANIVVIGSESFIFESTARTCSVTLFHPKLGVSSKVPIVDGAICYDCPYSGESYILIIRNALYLPHLRNNLIAPFIMRSASVTINERPKIHCDDPTVDNYCAKFDDSDLRIPLKLNGIFSYFQSRKPTIEELHELPKLFLTPDADDWNPHSHTFGDNEESMFDFNGEMADKGRRKDEICIFEQDEIPELSSVSIEEWESNIDANILSAHVAPAIPSAINDPILEFADTLNVREEVSKVAASIGNCNLSQSISTRITLKTP